MKFFAIEPPSLMHGFYPTFLGVDGEKIVNGTSDRHATLVQTGSMITILNKDGGVTWNFADGKSANNYTIREVDTSKPLQRYLLWYVWIGTGKPDMLIQSIKSYIQIGGFIGDIVVLSDQNKFEALNPFPNVRFIKVQPKQLFKKLLITRLQIFCIKPLIGQYVDLSKYDWMFYSDADILCVKPNLMPLLQSMDDKGFFYYSKDNGCLDHRSIPCGKGIVTEEEIAKYGTFSCNAGWIFLPCNELGHEVLRVWAEMEKAHDYEIDDQGCLYALLIRQTWPRKLAIGIRAAWDGYSMKPMQSESQIIHFYGFERYLQDIMAKELRI